MPIQAIAQTSSEGYPAMWQALSAAARSATDQGRKEHGKVLCLLADACSMMLSPSSWNDPFKPYVVSDADITFFAQIVDRVDDDWLKARLADLVWLKGKPRNSSFALKAIDAYRSIQLVDAEWWLRDRRECWERAISLAQMLKSGAGNRLDQMEATIIDAFNAATRQDSFLGLKLVNLLKSKGLGSAHQANIAKKLEDLAHELDGEGDLHWAREYFSAAADWYRYIPNTPKATEMTVAVAEGYVKEAIARVSSDNPSHAVAAHFYENAIQTYRTIPRSERGTHRVDERIAELQTLLNDAGEKASGEMHVIQTPGIDITQLVEEARKSISGKSVRKALLAFANLHSGANVEELRQRALERIREAPMPSIFPSYVRSRDGRVIAKCPTMSCREPLTEDDEIAVRFQMIHHGYTHFIGLVVQGLIWPALETLLLEHRLRDVDFVDLAQNSPIIPKDRAGLFGKALFAGYECDFVTALHLLIPQIEHMVRVHLKEAGANTSNIDKDGIQTENGLSALMDLPEAEQVFGKNLTFELKSLFCDPFGSNLRNELAHGLLDEDACYSPFAIYAWWLALRLTFNTWWNAARKN